MTDTLTLKTLKDATEVIRLFKALEGVDEVMLRTSRFVDPDKNIYLIRPNEFNGFLLISCHPDYEVEGRKIMKAIQEALNIEALEEEVVR